MRISRLSCGLFAALLLLGAVFAGAGSTARADEFPSMSPQELKSLTDSGQPCFLLNPLSDLEFGEGHIPTSVNVPLHTMETSDLLPEDLNTPIVTYCLGTK